MKPVILVLLGALVFVCAFRLASILPVNVSIDESEIGLQNQYSEVRVGMPPGYGLLIVVEPEGYYFGENCVTLQEVKGIVDSEKLVHSVNSIKIVASSSAKYGDVIALLDLLRKDKSYYSTISIRSLPSGDRLNLWAYYKFYCCGSDDILSKDYRKYFIQHR